MIFKKSFEVDLENTVFVLLKTNGAKQSCVLYLTYKASAVDTAKVDKIESSSAHYEHRLKVVYARYGCEVIDKSALGSHSELADANEIAVNCCLISQGVGYVRNGAVFSALLLMIF